MENNKNKTRFPKWPLIGLAVLISLLLFVSMLLAIHLGSSAECGPDQTPCYRYLKGDLGTLGDFIGGVLNPLLSFITICLLIGQLRLQSSELAATRDTLNETKNIHNATALTHERALLLQQANDYWPAAKSKMSQLVDRVETLYYENAIPVFPEAEEVTIDRLANQHDDSELVWFMSNDSYVALLEQSIGEIVSIAQHYLDLARICREKYQIPGILYFDEIAKLNGLVNHIYSELNVYMVNDASLKHCWIELGKEVLVTESQ
ncbi:hypothetical protein [Bowmanella denitrificans]|uniref:hypothetical protein n=1 Tax=Bowmanella denitrificans TaxID=366582 RepID=UPI000C9CF0E6|nr:hypothetical protein [Bowmanella denitrificans]